MRDLLRIIEQAMAADQMLYHTTSGGALLAILEHREIRPKSSDAFVSLSERPLPSGDIEGKDVSIGFRAECFASQTLKVEYDPDWFFAHSAQAAYIAGEGWIEQYQEPDDAYDDEGWADDDALEAHRQDAEYTAFEDKLGEDEHISMVAGRPVTFERGDVVQIIVHQRVTDADLARLRDALRSLGYTSVTIAANRRIS